MKPDPKPYLEWLYNIRTKLETEIQEVDHNIQQIQQHGLHKPSDIYLVQINCYNGIRSLCIYCAKYTDDEGWCYYNQAPDILGGLSDTASIICPKCAWKMAPYLTRVLLPWIRKNEKFFRTISDSPEFHIHPLLESRVPYIMEILSKTLKLKAFL